MFKTTTSTLGSWSRRAVPQRPWLAPLVVGALVSLCASAHAQTATITDTTAAGATNDNNIGGSEYAGFVQGSNIGGGSCFDDQLGGGVKLHWESAQNGDLMLALDDTTTGTCAFKETGHSIVIYVDSKTGGFTNTEGMNDAQDDGRRAIAGTSSDIYFAPTFDADYAIVLRHDYAGLFQLAEGGNNSLIHIKDLTRSSDWDWNDGTVGCRKELSGFTMADLGDAAGGSFDFVATFLDASSGYRSCEFVGVSTTSPTVGTEFGGNFGFSDVTLQPGGFARFLSYSPCARFTGSRVSYAQDFNSLATSGTSTSLPAGWAVSQSPYTAGTGSSGTGGIYSFGSTGASDRAIGSVASGGTARAHGVCFVNQSSGPIKLIRLSYTGEQWRKADNAAFQKIDFQYSLTATAVTPAASWPGVLNLDTLDFSGPIATSAAAAALDGNASANRRGVGPAFIPNLSLEDGAVIWIRWLDSDDGGTDHGLAIDDLVVTPFESGDDFGDAPASYGTARHSIATMWFGSSVDSESAQLFSANADGDDTDQTPDDEDGVVWPATIVRGQTYPLTVTANQDVTFLFWVDWDHNGAFDADEMNAGVATGGQLNSLQYTAHSADYVGPTYARIRTGLGLSDPTGDMGDGEVEDYIVSIVGRCGDGWVDAGETCDDGDSDNGDGCSSACQAEDGWACGVAEPSTCACAGLYHDPNPSDGIAQCALVDYGDALDTYGTLLASNGARHVIVNSLPRLGAAVTADADGTPTANADGDSDDGFVSQEDLYRGTVSGVSVNARAGTDPAVTCAWIDWQQDGAFDNSDYLGAVQSAGSFVGTQMISASVPADAPLGATRMRTRIKTGTTCLNTDDLGLAADGEVEDYVVSVRGCGDLVKNGGEGCDDGDGDGANDGCNADCTIATGWTCPGNVCACNTASGYQSIAGQCVRFDFGDVGGIGAGPYPTLLTDDGARHFDVTGSPYFGTALAGQPDFELGTLQSIAADGDDTSGQDDESTAVPMTITKSTTGLSFTFPVTATGNWQAALWVDWDRDGVFDLGGDIAAVTSGTSADTQGMFTFDAPSDAAIGVTGMRLRIASTFGAGPDSGGAYVGGEVEDYVVTLVARCGDGVIDTGEMCDQGTNDPDPQADGDGCSTTCQEEPGWTCTGTPSSCTSDAIDLYLSTFQIDDADIRAVVDTTVLSVGLSNVGPFTATAIVVRIAHTAGLVYEEDSGNDCVFVDATHIDCAFDDIAVGGTSPTLFVTFSGLLTPATAGQTIQVSNVSSSPADLDSNDWGGVLNVTVRYCGDGTRQSTAPDNEACDDGNTAPGDGCSATCAVEPGFDCTGQGAGSCKREVDVGVALAFGDTDLYATETTSMTLTVSNHSTHANADASSIVVEIDRFSDMSYGTLPADCSNFSATKMRCTIAALENATSTTRVFTTVNFLSNSTSASRAHGVLLISHGNTDPVSANNSGTATVNHRYCGDSTADTGDGEQCDTGPSRSNTTPNACRTSCLAASCGDGVIDAGAPQSETCDDGDPSPTLPNAGCPASCVFDATNWQCTGTTSVCVQRADLAIGTFDWSATPVYNDGEASSLRVSVQNKGPGAAAGVKVKVTRPTNLTLNVAGLPGACVQTDGNAHIECTIGALAANTTSGTFTIPFTVPNGQEEAAASSTLVAITQTSPVKNPGDDTGGSATLAIHFCGDGLRTQLDIDNGEECDDGNAQNLDQPNKCRVLCKLPRCGDHIVDTSALYGSETCDDGNAVTSDDCPTGSANGITPLCRLAACGDGYTHLTTTGLPGAGPIETCDDGDKDNQDDCPDGVGGTCKANVCGDGHRDLEGPTTEGCDDGNKTNSDACPDNTAVAGAGGHPHCVPASCGDGFVRTTEGCDDGNADINDACPDGAGGSCQQATCGDGFVNFKTLVSQSPAEDCDQGTAPSSGDGCSIGCKLEAGYTCTNVTNQSCAATCRVDYAFTSAGRSDFLASDRFAFGTSSKWANQIGWVTSPLDANAGNAAFTATLVKAVAIPPRTAGRAPMIRVEFELDVDSDGLDCFDVHLDTAVSTVAGTRVASRCTDTTGTTSFDIPVTGFTAGGRAIVTLVLRADTATTARKGVIVKALRFLSDVDGDGAHEVKNLSCSDACVDGDADSYGDVVTSRDLSSCTPNPNKPDCNDQDAAIKPDIDETACTDAIDNNCDGKTDGADTFCFEICGDFVDNGKKRDGSLANNGVDCGDPQCAGFGGSPGRATDPYCATPCLSDWSFTSGDIFSEATSDAVGALDDIFFPTPDPADGWTAQTSDATRKIGKLQFTIPDFGGVAKRGPKPQLLVNFSLAANPVGRDIFAVCVESPDCRANALTNITRLAEGTRTNALGVVDLTPYLGNAGPDGHLQITFLFDTNEGAQASPTTVRLDITRVRLASDIDGDASAAGGYEGTPFPGQAACDACWDADRDGWGLAASPDIRTCCFSSNASACAAPPVGCAAGTSSAACVDCNDDPTPGKGANAHPPLTADEGLCGDGIDNNCNGLTDGQDAASCGSEDCANGVDDNGDNVVDCADASCGADPACSACETSYELEKGRDDLASSAGFVPSAGNIFQWGRNPGQYGGNGGWWTVRAGDISLVQPTGAVKATLSKTLVVSTSFEQPTVELVYDLVGAGTSLGLCIDKPASLCDGQNPVNLAWSRTVATPVGSTPRALVNNTYRAGGLDHTFVPMPKGTHTIVIVFQATSPQVDGLFLDAVRVRSDLDFDGKGEATALQCDHCIDVDGDGRGAAGYGVSDLATCPIPYAIDCNDQNELAFPRDDETGFCFVDVGGGVVDAGDNDCDGLADTADPDCNVCGDNRLGPGETCDPPSSISDPSCVANNDCECTDQCQISLSSANRIYVTEMHLPILYGRRAEQWIEIYNPAPTPLNLLDAGLKIEACPTLAGSSPPAPDRDNCRFVSVVPQATPGGVVAPACSFTSRTTIGGSSGGGSRWFVIGFGPPSESDFYDSTLIDVACQSPAFTFPSASEWLIVSASGADLDRVPMAGFGTCLFANQQRAVGAVVKARSIVLENAETQAAASNNVPSVWCLAGRDQFYSNTDNHYGSPGAPGGCAEVVCDGIDDDCDDNAPGAIDLEEATELAPYGEDVDGDHRCNARDCDPADARCNTNCVADADLDGSPDCKDTCFDVDGDGYGNATQDTSGCGGLVEAASCDGDGFSNPGLTETSVAACTNDDRDNDCDGQTNCSDSGCTGLTQCAGETCALATPVACGASLTIVANSEEMPMCDVGVPASDAVSGRDRVFKFVAPAPTPVSFIVENLGSRRYEIYAAAGGNPAADDSCSPTSCAQVFARGAALCADPAQIRVAAPVVGETYTIVMKSQGSCNFAASGAARFTVLCSESCGATGIDEDNDGLTDCFDPDCALESACGARDPDGDGVSNADEIKCLCPNLDPSRPEECPAPRTAAIRPSNDDVSDTDGDLLINCIDPDDDNDLASDALELSLCKSPTSKNNSRYYPARDLCVGASCGPAAPECCVSGTVPQIQQCRDEERDANCNGAIDANEAAACGTLESNCGDLVDDDVDGATDCDDPDCVFASLCALEDYDGDCVSNRVEILCNTDVREPGTSDPGQPCAGGAASCAFAGQLRFKNNDGLSLTPSRCVSDPPNICTLPLCFPDDIPNCADTDDDGDFYDDVQEVICGSDPTSALSLPPDLPTPHPTFPNTMYQDRQCDSVDPDDDNDGFDDILERSCALDLADAEIAPRDWTNTPTDLRHDIDQDGTCNNVDDDDDGDGWPDTVEIQCGTDPNRAGENPTALFQDVDGDKLCNLFDTDDDGDGWSDIDEIACTGVAAANQPLDVPRDTDGDRTCDTLDTDDDNDAVDDATEIGCGTDPKDRLSYPTEGDAQDPDGDDLPNCIDPDDDGDLVSDANEALIGSDRLVRDTDGDGIDDGVENADKDGTVDETETSPINTDTDGDGLGDRVELESGYPTGVLNQSAPTKGWDRDSDDDGLLDGQEDANHDGNLDAGETNPIIADSDGDGFVDGEEIRCKTDPLSDSDVPQDKDGDEECDQAQLDTDRDNVPDGVETFCGFDPLSAQSTPSFADLADTDLDGDINCVDADDDDDTFTDVEETICGRKPRDATDKPSDDDRRDYDGDGTLNCADPDDDDDGLGDIVEGQLRTDPQDRDSDDDGLSDGREVDLQLDPLDVDTDDDGMQDGTEVGLTQGTIDTDLGVFIPDANPSTVTNPRIADTDGDGVSDGDEDTNKNGRVDSDQDPPEGDPLDPTDGLADTDNDGLIDRDERNIHHTDPNDPDSDDDGLDDKLEVDVYFTDPNDPDHDGGGVMDGFEVANGTDPKDPSDDYESATLTGDNIFGCGGASDAGLFGLAMMLLMVLAARRRRKA